MIIKSHRLRRLMVISNKNASYAFKRKESGRKPHIINLRPDLPIFSYSFISSISVRFTPKEVKTAFKER